MATFSDAARQRLQSAQERWTALESAYLIRAADLWRASTCRHLDAARQYADDLTRAQGPRELFDAQRTFLSGIGQQWLADARAWSELAGRTRAELADAWKDGSKRAARLTDEAVPGMEQALSATVVEVPEPEPAAAPDPEADRLDRINGVGAVFVKQLEDAGITSLAQMAELDLDALLDDAHPLHALHGRIASGGWVDQAQALLAGKPH